MPAVTSSDEFLRILRQSALVDEPALTTSLAQCNSGTLPAEPKELATYLVKQGLLTTFQARNLLAGKTRGYSIGKYRILEPLGAGGMGQVFLCEHRQMRRLVAVKVLSTKQLSERSAVERFYREARAVAALDHPNIVRAYDVDQDEKTHYLVMEYVYGSSLADIVRKSGPMEVGRACHYIRQAALGLHHAHMAGWIHRDIKPGNLLLDRNGVLKILDMGLARPPLSGRDSLTQQFDENCVLGTADYLAPEQAMNSHDVDIRADIYSLGASLYYLLVGKAPFGEGTTAQKLLWHQLKTPPPVEQTRPEIPAALLTILAKMLAKQPEKRYAVPAALANELTPLCKGVNPKPAESEMPQWCPAVLRVLQGEAGGPTPRPSATMPLPAVPKPSAPKTPSKAAVAVQAAPRSQVAAPVAETLKAKEETTDDTAPMEPRRKPPAPKQTKPPVGMLLAIGIGAVVILGAVAGVFLLGGEPATSTSPAPTYVTSQPVALAPERPAPTVPKETPETKPSGPPVIASRDAAKHVDETCVVRVVVRSTGKNASGIIFLNSEADYKSADNVTVLIRPVSLAKFAEKDIADPREFYKGKTLHVTGKITTYNNALQIEVTEPAQIEVMPGEG